jgi:hypothetical protein
MTMKCGKHEEANFTNLKNERVINQYAAFTGEVQ